MKFKREKIYVFFLLFVLLLGCNIPPEEKTTPTSTDTVANTTHSTTAVDTTNIDTTTTGSDNYSIYFINVGQGDSILIETNQKHYVLIDSGPSDASNKLGTFLTSKGISSIQDVILTHTHTDHYGEFKDIVGSYSIGTFLFANYPSDNSTYKSLLDKLTQNAISKNEKRDGSSFSLDNLTFIFYAPPVSGFLNTSSDVNDNSMVIKVSNQSGVDLLVTGDIEVEGISSLLSRHGSDIDIELLKVSHHGSSNGTTKAFLDATTPIDAFISVGTGNSYGHPHQSTIDLLRDKGINIHRTDYDGNIGVSVTGNTYAVSTHI